MSAVDWTTRVDPQLTRLYGCEEIHGVCFEPVAWAAHRPVVGLLIPECELQFTFMANGEPVSTINRPQTNKSVKGWLRYACKLATEHRAFISFACDTTADADRAAKRAAKLLPTHRRIALERMHEATSRERGKLS
jgi:hypothetical protein